MQLSALDAVGKLCHAPASRKTLLQHQVQLSTTQPVTEFSHLAGPWFVCPPCSVHAWEAKNIVFEFHTFTERNSTDIKKYIACDSHMLLALKNKPTGEGSTPFVWSFTIVLGLCFYASCWQFRNKKLKNITLALLPATPVAISTHCPGTGGWYGQGTDPNRQYGRSGAVVGWKS